MQGENKVLKYFTVCSLMLSGIVASNSVLAQEINADLQAEQKASLVSDGQSVSKEVKPQIYNKTVVDNVAKYRAKQAARNGANPNEAADIAKIEDADTLIAKENEAAAINDALVSKNSEKKSETLLEKVRAERQKQREEAAKEPLKSGREAAKAQREKEKAQKEERRNMTREESRKTQLELRQLYKEQKEERREIRQNTTRAERREMKKNKIEAEKKRRENYKLQKEKRKEMRKLDK